MILYFLNTDSDNVTFFSDCMGLVNVDLNNVMLDYDKIKFG